MHGVGPRAAEILPMANQNYLMTAARIADGLASGMLPKTPWRKVVAAFDLPQNKLSEILGTTASTISRGVWCPYGLIPVHLQRPILIEAMRRNVDIHPADLVAVVNQNEINKIVRLSA